MKSISAETRGRIVAELREYANRDELACARAFKVAEELGVGPLEIGRVADEAGVRFVRCQLGLFGYAPTKSIVAPAENVDPHLESLLRDMLVLGRLPCATAWAIANHLGIGKLDVSSAAEALGIRIGQCQLGGF